MVGLQKLWYKMSTDEVLNFCDTNIVSGLSNDQVKIRSEKYGFNKPAIFNINSQNFYRYSTLRNGKFINIASNKLVLGDIVKFKAGDIAPANFRIIKVNKLKVNEETITGNYTPTTKNSLRCQTICSLDNQANMLFMGSQIVAGQALAVLVSDDLARGIATNGTKTNRLLKLNNFVANQNNLPKYLSTISCVVFDDLKNQNEIEDTIVSIFLAKNIACIYLLDNDMYVNAQKFLQSPRIINHTTDIIHFGNEIAIIPKSNQNLTVKMLAMLKALNRNNLYVYRGESFKPEALVADLNLVINKNSSHQALFNASFITNGINHTQLSRILYNNY
jgi:magnesium-transporting ATPase (P-type)